MGLSDWRARLVPRRPGPLLLSGLLLGLAHPPFHLLLPSFAGLVPYYVWLAELPPGPEGRSEARRGGFFLGLIYFTIVFYWLVVALVFYTWLAVPAFLAPVLAMSGLLAVMTGLVKTANERLRWPLWLGLPVFWTATEWLRSHVPEIGFPWMELGDTLTGFPWLIGAADLVGARGLSFWLVLAGALIGECVLAWRRGPPRRIVAPTVSLSVVLALPIGYSLLRWNTLEMRPVARVGVIQPNVPEEIKLERRAAVDSARRATETLVREDFSSGDPLDLLVLPETVLPVPIEPIPSLGYEGRPDLEFWVAGLARRLDSYVLYGAIGVDDRGDGTYEHYNSALLVDETGIRRARYDKRYLVPVIERVPYLNSRWFGGLTYFGGFGVGGFVPPLRTPSASFGVMICYESIYTRLGRHYRRRGADYLVNITNDAWFGRERSWWTKSSALWQHPAHLVMRVVETRIGAVRSGNTGISEILDPLGRAHHATALFTPAAFSGRVLTTDGLTLYVRMGDIVGRGSAIVAALAWLLTWRRGLATGVAGRGSDE